MRREGATENTYTSNAVTSYKLSPPIWRPTLAAPALRVGTDDQSCSHWNLIYGSCILRYLYRRSRYSDALVESSDNNNLQTVRIPRDHLLVPSLITDHRDFLD